MLLPAVRHCVKPVSGLSVTSMNPLQSKMARTALGWSVTDLSTFSGVGRSTVARFELGQNVQPDRVQAMRRAFEGKGVQFVDSGKLAGAVIPPRC